MRAPDFWYPKTGRKGGVLSHLLSPLGAAYGAAGRFKRAMTKPGRPAIPVICVGNLTAGGTGKTPIAIAIAERLLNFEIKAAFLTRGYGGRLKGPVEVTPDSHGFEEVGDEALLLARTAPVFVSRNRFAGARLATVRRRRAIVMDDGFQNPGIEKTLSFVVVDAGVLFGNGRIIPAGPLREPVEEGLARADAVILMGDGSAGREDVPALKNFPGPVIRARLRLEPKALSQLIGRPFVAFAGIGRPEKFFASAREAGVTLAETRSFADHHPYRERDLADLEALANDHGAELLTTEKDWVRLPAAWRDKVRTLPVYATFDPESALFNLLREKILPLTQNK